MSKKIGTITKIKYHAYRVFEILLGSVRGTSKNTLWNKKGGSYPSASTDCLWIFASTVGELNAHIPLIKRLINSGNYNHLIIVSDRKQYASAYEKAFPNAILLFIENGNDFDWDSFSRHPPKLFLITEIPLLLMDAPCRFPFRFIYETKKQSGKIVASNGWLYDQGPSCTSDRLEYLLFKKDFHDLIDTYAVQDHHTSQRLIHYGVNPDKVHVTGNLKFDNFFEEQALEHSITTTPDIDIQRRPTIVSGCVTNISEQELILDAFVLAQKKSPELLLILAPRHPENKERMIILDKLLTARSLKSEYRSKGNIIISTQTDVFILDTFGELNAFYKLGNICYVGLNHNILEPLKYSKPVLVSSGWNPKFPSFPLYKVLLDKGIISQSESNPSRISEIFLSMLSDPQEKPTAEAIKCNGLNGALNKNFTLITSEA